MKHIKGKEVIVMTELNKEQQADYEHAIDMAQDLIEKMGDTWDGVNFDDIIFSIGVAVDALCEVNGYPQELANAIINGILTSDDDIDEELDEDDLEIITSDGIDLDDDSLEFLKRSFSSKDNN